MSLATISSSSIQPPKSSSLCKSLHKLDDYGLTRVPDNIVCALTEIADVRYGMGSTIITTQLRKKALKSVIDESPIRDALADRLFRDCDIEITLKGTSWRGSNEELKGEKNDK